MKQPIERHVLQTGGIALIQRFKHKYSCFVVSPIFGEPPEFHVESGSLSDCREALAAILESDVLDTI
jgi:hypothetical protein